MGICLNHEATKASTSAMSSLFHYTEWKISIGNSLRSDSINYPTYLIEVTAYCKFRNFCVTFISQIFYFSINSEFLNSQAGVHVFYKVYSDHLLARTLNSRGNHFANISEN